MSTKISIAYDNNYHLYSECFEENKAIHLQLTNISFEASPDTIVVRIPKDVMLAILNNADEIRSRLNSEDWNETQEPTEWKKSE